MKQELADQLIKRYPRVFAQLKRVEAPKGWFNLIDRLASIIEHHLDYIPEEIRSQIYATQWKEKFASARFYMSHQTSFIDGAIEMAQSMSATICQDCGGAGSHRTVGHTMATLCDMHYQEHKENRELELVMQAKKTP